MKLHCTGLTNDEIILLIIHIEEECGYCDVLGCPCDEHMSPRHILTEAHVPLALALAKKFSRKNNDARGEALLKLVKIMDQIEYLKDISNIAAYINVSITQHLKRYVIEDSLIKYKSDAKNIDKIKTYFQLIEDKIIDRNCDQVILNELLSGIIKTTIERKVLEHLVSAKGENDKEVAAKLNMSASNLSRIKRILYRRAKNVCK